MKITTEDCVKSIVEYLIEKENNFTNTKDWKRISKTGTGDNIIRKFQNKVSNREIYVRSSESEIFEVSKNDTTNIITKFDNFKPNDKKLEESDSRVFVTSYGRDIFKDCLEVYRKNNNVSYQDVKDDMKNYYGLIEGDIVYIENSFPIGKAQILKMKYDEYGGSCVLKVIEPIEKYDFAKKGEQLKGYALTLLSSATLVTPVTNVTIIPKIKKEKSKKSKYILEVEDFSISNIDWQKETYSDYDINIGITVYVKGEDYMYDDEVLPELPELENLGLGEIQMDENGFIGITSDLSVVEIKNILSDNGFEIK